MKGVIITLIILSIFLISGANGCGSETIDSLKQDLEEKDKKLVELERDIGDLQKQIKELEKEPETIVEEEKEEKVDHIDVSAWKQDDFISALAAKSDKFENNEWYDYEYRDDGSYYYVAGEDQDIDAFYSLAYDNKKDRELSPSKLRIHALGAGNTDKAQEDYNNYASNIDKALVLDSDLSCNRLEICGLKIIKCNKDNNNYLSWFTTLYLFEIRNNDESLETFKSFYCIE